MGVSWSWEDCGGKYGEVEEQGGDYGGCYERREEEVVVVCL